MSQANWLYKDETGKVHDINIYHGDESGHLLIYVNDEIMRIAFNVSEAIQYSFYIENVFFEMAVVTTEEGFSYQLHKDGIIFEQNIKPEPIIRNADYHNIKMLLIIAIFILFMLFIYCLIF